MFTRDVTAPTVHVRLPNEGGEERREGRGEGAHVQHARGRVAPSRPRPPGDRFGEEEKRDLNRMGEGRRRTDGQPNSHCGGGSLLNLNAVKRRRRRCGGTGFWKRLRLRRRSRFLIRHLLTFEAEGWKGSYETKLGPLIPFEARVDIGSFPGPACQRRTILFFSFESCRLYRPGSPILVSLPMPTRTVRFCGNEAACCAF